MLWPKAKFIHSGSVYSGLAGAASSPSTARCGRLAVSMDDGGIPTDGRRRVRRADMPRESLTSETTRKEVI
ncbi:hypothetical protein RESH_02405 [Rhodopirellula europaea SH398]|uniref:Uncharacterized protein n=1 Tax=Rhodopirellula europaea SH398 TaxID=1263868 RepID=M5S6K8_9BACT|nr:hypothetical protein RESH_02405 [Rhodopirellula europaea SH398]